MANKSKAIGTGGENDAVTQFNKGGIKARRAREAPISEHEASWDLWLEDLPWVSVEVKRRKQWDLRAWARKAIDAIAHDSRRRDWVLWLVPRDKRKTDALPSLMVVEGDFGLYLLSLYQDIHDDGS